MPRSIAQLAWERGIPVLELGRLAASETLAALVALRPDVACVSCWARRIPPALLRLPPRGFLNLHPSLLPRHRGPVPVFWALREDEPLGVTVHVMDEVFDTGPILGQSPVDAPDDASGPEIDRLCGEAGGRLLVEALAALAEDRAAPCQQPEGGSYESFPHPADFALDVAWPARRAFRFMHGTAEWGEPYPVATGGARLLLQTALGYAAGERLGVPFVREGEIVRVQFVDGVLDVTHPKPNHSG
jgi:methionyl-tRNA formyltransferase